MHFVRNKTHPMAGLNEGQQHNKAPWTPAEVLGKI
jgi:hypothetical protein